MQIVIEIDDELYKEICIFSVSNAEMAIKNGIILPENRGRKMSEEDILCWLHMVRDKISLFDLPVDSQIKLKDALGFAMDDVKSVICLKMEIHTLSEEVKKLKGRKKKLNKKIKELMEYKKDYEELYYNTGWEKAPDMMGK